MGDGTFTLGNLRSSRQAGRGAARGRPRRAGGQHPDHGRRRPSRGLANSASSVPAAARMASHTPARALGLTDVGTIRVGARADLVLLDDEAHLRATMRRGEW